MTASPGEDPDLELLGGVGRGDAAAARMMVARKLPRLLALATRMLGDPTEAEDVAQKCFVRLWRQAPLWRAGEGRVDTWLHRVALNLCYDRLGKRREITVELLPDCPEAGPAPSAALDEADTTGQVAAALQALPERQREAIVLQTIRNCRTPRRQPRWESALRRWRAFWRGPGGDRAYCWEIDDGR